MLLAISRCAGLHTLQELCNLAAVLVSRTCSEGMLFARADMQRCQRLFLVAGLFRRLGCSRHWAAARGSSTFAAAVMQVHRLCMFWSTDQELSICSSTLGAQAVPRGMLA